MKKRIFFDLDGVLRNLCKDTFGEHPPTWNHKNKDGKDMIDLIEENLDILEKAPPTRYIGIREHIDHMFILTHQHPEWQWKTKKWIEKHIGGNHSMLVVLSTIDKLHLMDLVDGVLIEDSPKFPYYDRVVLIDRPYNQEVKGEIARVKSLEELIIVIKENL
jgi:hypothetical protein